MLSGVFKKVNNIFFGDKFLLSAFIFSLVINIFLWLWLYLTVSPKELPVPLHYNIYFGIDLIGEWYKIFFIPFSGFVILFINFLISFIIYRKQKIISYFLSALTGLFQLFLFWAAFLIVSQIS